MEIDMSRRIITSLLIAALLLVLAYPCFAAPRKDNLGRTIWTRGTLSLTVKATDELSGVKTVELWYRMNGGIWKKWSEEPESGANPGSFKYNFKAPQDGVYEFYSVSIDAVGNTSATPSKESTPMATIHFDSNAPDLRATCVNESDRIKPGDNISFRWSASDSSLREVKLKYYFNGEKSKPAYRTLKGTNGLDKLQVPQRGVNSVTLCLIGEDYAGFKSETKLFSFVVEGSGAHAKELDAPSPVQPRKQHRTKKYEPEKLDTTHSAPATPEITRPAAPERQIPAEKKYEVVEELNPNRSQIDDSAAERDPYCVVLRYNVARIGVSGLKKVELWVARIDGENRSEQWTLKDWSSKPQGRFIYKAPASGRYAFYITAVNMAGAWSKDRPNGVNEIKPDYTQWIDPNRPSMSISVPKPTAESSSDVASVARDNRKPQKAYSPAPLSAPRTPAPSKKIKRPPTLMSAQSEKPAVRTAPVTLPDPTDASGHLKR